MKKKDMLYIVGLSMVASVVWIVVELLMMWRGVPGVVFLIWRIFIVVTTCVISVRHGFKEDKKNKNTRQTKYKRKKKRK